MSEATPRPLYYEADRVIEGPKKYRIWHKDRRIVYAHTFAEDNAKEITRAVNNHQQLVEALEAALQFIRDDYDECLDEIVDDFVIVKQIQAALDAAKG